MITYASLLLNIGSGPANMFPSLVYVLGILCRIWFSGDLVSSSLETLLLGGMLTAAKFWLENESLDGWKLLGLFLFSGLWEIAGHRIFDDPDIDPGETITEQLLATCFVHSIAPFLFLKIHLHDYFGYDPQGWAVIQGEKKQ